jgi:hypothetical protein
VKIFQDENASSRANGQRLKVTFGQVHLGRVEQTPQKGGKVGRALDFA